MVKDICRVINNTGRDIQIDEIWEKYIEKETEKSPPRKGPIVRKDAATNIKRSEFRKSWERMQRSIDGELYKLVSLLEDDKNGVLLSMKEIEANIDIVISMGKNNQLVKELVSMEVSKSFGKKKEIVVCWARGLCLFHLAVVCLWLISARAVI